MAKAAPNVPAGMFQVGAAVRSRGRPRCRSRSESKCRRPDSVQGAHFTEPGGGAPCAALHARAACWQPDRSSYRPWVPVSNGGRRGPGAAIAVNIMDSRAR